MAKTKFTAQDFQKLNLLALHASANAPHQGAFHNFAADFEDMFPTPVGHVDQRDDYRSALSPAAYLVDLVRLVNEHITPPADDRLALPKRRPDIFELELSQEKAEQPVPYLDIANQVMRTYLEESLQITPSALEQLARSHFPFDLPFHLPLTEIRTYLQHFQIDLADLYAAFMLSTADPAWVAETLNLAPGELTYLATSSATADSLSEAYGVTISDASPLGGLDTVETFLAQTDLTLAQLEMLMLVHMPGSPLSLAPAEPAAGAAPTPFGQAPVSITNLTLPILDYLNRFIRLANRLGWSFDDLDWALTTIGATLIKSVDNNQADLHKLAQIEYLHNQYKLPIDVLCGFCNDLRTTPPFNQPDGDSFFDQVFNIPPFYHGDGKPAVDKYDPLNAPIIWDSTGNTTPGDVNPQKVRASLQGALKIGFADLDAIVKYLFADKNQLTSITLDLSTLTRLYRLSKLAQVLGMPVSEYLALLKILTKPDAKSPTWYLTTPEVSSIDDMLTVAKWANWLTATGLNAFQLQYLTTGILSDAAVRAVGQVLTPSAATISVNNYLKKLTDWAVKPAALVHSGVNAETATAILNSLIKGQLLDANGLVIQSAAAITEDAVYGAIGDYLFAATWGRGLYVSRDSGLYDNRNQNGITWSPVSDGLPATQIYQVVTIGDQLFAVTQEQGVHHVYVSHDDGAKWSQISTVPVTYINQVITIGARLFVATKDEGLYVSADNGTTWSQVSVGDKPTQINQVVAIGARVFAATLGQGLYVSDNNGATWQPVSSLPAKQIGQVVAIGSRLFATTDEQDFYVSADNGTTWSQVSVGDKPTQINQIANGGNRLFAATLGQGLYVSDNNGATWQPVSGLAAPVVIQVVAIGSRLFAATSIGLYVSADNGVTWSPVSTVPGTYINQVVAIADHLFAVTLEQGLYVNSGLIGATWSQVSTVPVTRITQVVAIGDPLMQAVQRQTGAETLAYIQAVVKTLKNALDQQTKGAVAFWSGVLSADAALVSAALTYIAEVDKQNPPMPIAQALVQKGTAQAGDEQTITLAVAARGATVDQGLSILITTGAGAGQIGIITAYDAATQLVTVAQPWQTAPDATSQYVIIKLAAVDQLALLVYLAQAFALSVQQFQSILRHAPMFGNTDLSAVDRFKALGVLRQIADFKQLTQAFAQQGDASKTATYVNATTTDLLANSAEALLRYLSANSNDDTLATLSGWDAAQIVALNNHLAEMATKSGSATPMPHPLSHLATPQRCFDLATKLGVDIQLLIDLCKLHSVAEQPDDHSWPTYVSTAQSFLSVVRAQYSLEDWNKTFAPLRDQLNELERNALTAFLLRQLQGQFSDIKTQQDLYEFLLVDVEMSGCAQTTYVREAIDCLQIYIQRCRMNLEPGVSLSEAIPDDLWDWMGHYRLWQANRQIFFYPENYLDPTLRTQEATPEFKALQSELLQGDINKDTVEQAYINYFDKLDQLANLIIVNGCYAKAANPNSGNVEDTLFLLGRTATEPPVYYQRRALLAADKNGVLTGDITLWSPWQKIDVNIPADQALPLYAADRLYLFWVEQKTITDRNNTPPTKTIATIKFSHQQVSGRWVQPQTLAKDIDFVTLPQAFWFAPGGLNAQGSYLFLSQQSQTATTTQTVLSPIASAWSNTLAPWVSTLLPKHPATRVVSGLALPFDIPTTWSASGLPTMNITQVVAIGNRLFAASWEQGLYASDDNGTTWSPVGGLPAEIHQVVAIGNRLFAPTTTGLYISGDLAGTTWQLVDLVDALSTTNITQVVAIGNRLFAPTWGQGLYASDDNGATWKSIGALLTGTSIHQVVAISNRLFAATSLGLWFSEDLAETWQSVDQASGLPTTNITQVVAIGNSLFAATWGLGLYVSHNNGTTWSPIGGLLSGTSITQVVAIGNRLFAATTTGLYISGDLTGTTWFPIGGLPTTNITQVVAIGNSLFAATSTGLYISGDLVRITWQLVDPASDLPTMNITQVDAIDKRLFAATWGKGLYVSYDNGATWSPVGGLPAAEIHQVVAIGNRLFAPTTTGLYISGDLAGTTWQLVDLVDALSTTNITQVVAIGNRLFAPTWGQGLYFNDDNGATWKPIGDLVAGNITQVVAIGNRLFAATTTGLWFSDDNGPTWKPVGDLSATNITQVVAISNRLFAATTTGLYISGDLAGTTWQLIGQASGLPTTNITQVVTIGNYLFAATWGLGLYVSYDNGAMWFQIGGLPTAKITQVVAIGNCLFAATTTGLYQWKWKEILFMVAGGDTWLAMPPQPGAAQPAYHVQRLTTRCVHQLRQSLVQGGLDTLLTLQSQTLAETDFITLEPSALVAQPYPPKTMDFDLSGPYALYFREIFFHIPYLIGDTLQAHQRFAEAKRWYEYIFNPLTPPAPSDPNNAVRFWQYQPFRNHKLDDLAALIEDSLQYSAYENDPFDPFALAEIRFSAYEKALVMQYIDNLLAWGDSLYALDGWENLNAATTLYVLAAELLGPRPKATQSYSQVNGQLAPTALAAGRDVHQPSPDLADILKNVSDVANPFFDVPAFFFLPENDQFAGYWDLVAQRLYQIRHCMNLQGIVRQLPIFDPAIDPRQLLRAVAAGRSISSVATGATSVVPYYHFAYLLERARQVTSELKQLGGALLSALEKQDGEQLAVLRNTYEGALLNLTTLLKQKQQEENQHSLAGLQQSLASAQARRARYQGWATQRLSPGEQEGLSLTQSASDLKEAASVITALSGFAYALPNIFGVADGGMNFGKVVEVGAGMLNFEASILEWAGQLALTKAQYDRRQADWQLQADLANYDVQQINAQIDALNVRQAMADQELAIHQQTITQNQAIDQFYRQKFTSQELYQWMVGQLGALYFQTYQLALDLARMAERSFQYECNTDDSYVNVNGWDGLYKGLLAGEALALNLNQLEKAYIGQNARQLEIEKTISLLQVNPQALWELKCTGRCSFELSEALFDLDFPGHYLRKIKSISLSIPAVVGPYQNVRATLIQTSNKVALTPAVDTVKVLLGEVTSSLDSSKLRSNWQANQQIALSRGVNDAGLFELNFNDERYLPFEGTGALSTWELRMPKASNPIDFASISDVIINLRYTASDGGDAFRQQLLNKQSGAQTLQTLLGYRLFSVRQLNAAGWQAWKSGTQDSLTLSIDQAFFPLNLSNPTFMSSQDNKMTPIALYAWPPPNGDSPHFSLTLPGGKANAVSGWELTPGASDTLVGPWTIKLTDNSDPKTALQAIDDFLLIVPFQGALNWHGWLSGV